MADPHRPIYEVRDAVHGFVKLSAAERAVIDCPTFQRLREIRQLAVAHYVYPGATHTRFEHSIGCVHLSDMVFRALNENQQKGGRPTFADALGMAASDVERARKILRLAALLHDLGHPPFSHSGEHLLPALDSSTSSPGRQATEARVSHEDMTARLIAESEISQVIEKHYGNAGITPAHVTAVATKPRPGVKPVDGEPMLWFLNEILASDLGTDRMDYLLRDALHSGQPTGAFDHRKLLDTLTIIEEDPSGSREDRGGIRLGIDSGGWLIAEQMVVARYLMYMSLYFHKTKRIYEKHMERFLPHWLQQEFGSITFPTDVARYGRLTESWVLSDLFRAAHDLSHPGYSHARPFVDRSHYRQALELVLADNCRSTSVFIPQADGSRREVEVERIPDRKRLDSFAEFVRISFGDDAILDRADHSATKMVSPGHETLVLDRGKPRYLVELSEIVRGMPTRVWRCRVYSRPDRRNEVESACRQWLNANPAGRTQFDAKPRSES